MAYDFFNSLTPTTGHHAALYRSDFSGPTNRTGDAAVRQYLAAGVPASKIVLGVPFYGRGFAGVTPQNNGPYQRYEQSKDFDSYAQLVESFIDKQGFVRYWDAGARSPYLWNGASRSFITYEDPQSLAIKRCYVRDMHVGGMMFWELSLIVMVSCWTLSRAGARTRNARSSSRGRWRRARARLGCHRPAHDAAANSPRADPAQVSTAVFGSVAVSPRTQRTFRRADRRDPGHETPQSTIWLPAHRSDRCPMRSVSKSTRTSWPSTTVRGPACGTGRRSRIARRSSADRHVGKRSHHCTLRAFDHRARRERAPDCSRPQGVPVCAVDRDQAAARTLHLCLANY